MTRFAFAAACSLAVSLAASLAEAAPRTLPCISYGDCARTALPDYRLFEMDFANPQRYRDWLTRTGRRIVSPPTEEMNRDCAARMAAPRSESAERARAATSIGATEDLANVCVLPLARSWESANRWCQSNGWKLYRYIGETKLTCIIGSDA